MTPHSAEHGSRSSRSSNCLPAWKRRPGGSAVRRAHSGGVARFAIDGLRGPAAGWTGALVAESAIAPELRFQEDRLRCQCGDVTGGTLLFPAQCDQTLEPRYDVSKEALTPRDRCIAEERVLFDVIQCGRRRLALESTMHSGFTEKPVRPGPALDVHELGQCAP